MSNKVLVHCKNTDQILEINEGFKYTVNQE